MLVGFCYTKNLNGNLKEAIAVIVMEDKPVKFLTDLDWIAAIRK